MSLQPLKETVGKLQTALQTKAKAEPEYRFYALYDKVYRWDVLCVAYERCRANKGVAGVDGQTFDDIEEYGCEKWLRELTEELKNKTYQASPVQRAWIPKADGKQRPLGIPVMADRAQQALYLLAFDPIAETRADGNSYGFRPGRCCADALQQSRKVLQGSHSADWVLEGDIKSCFDLAS